MYSRLIYLPMRTIESDATRRFASISDDYDCRSFDVPGDFDGARRERINGNFRRRLIKQQQNKKTLQQENKYIYF